MHVRAMEAPEGENPGFFLAEGMTAPAERVPDREEAGQPCKYRGKQAKRLKMSRKMSWSEWQDSNLRPLRPERK